MTDLSAHGDTMESDSDSVYHKAVEKLRILLSAAEAVSMPRNDDEDDVIEDYDDEDATVVERGSVDHLAATGRNRLFVRNAGAASGWNRRAGSAAVAARIRHSSWHNLVHVGEAAPESTAAEVDLATDLDETTSLLQRQEAYIRQLERETTFCRDQLAIVVASAKDVLAARVGSATGIEDWSAMLTSDAQHLHAQLERVRAEAADMASREAEAAEQVKASIQAVEQMHMEKSELELELAQLRMQSERQQGRIRSLLEEQAKALDDERAAVETRFGDQLRAARDECALQAGEIGRLKAEAERRTQVEAELRRQMGDRDRLAEGVRGEIEKKLAQAQLEVVTLTSSRKQLEQELSGLRIDVEHANHELRVERGRAEAEGKTLRARLGKAEELLAVSRQECLDLASEKAALERELSAREASTGVADKENLRRMVQDMAKTAQDKEVSHRIAVEKLEALVRRQSAIIVELKNQCNLVVDRLEETTRSANDERHELHLTTQRLKQQKDRLATNNSNVSARGVLSTGGSEDLREALLRCATLEQEKQLVEHEAAFLKNMLKARGFLPEKIPRSAKKHMKAERPKAITVERGARIGPS